MKNASHVHSVHFYDDDHALIQRLQSIFASSLRAGHSVLLVATEEHRQQLAVSLKRLGIDSTTLKDRYRAFDAHEVLSKFMFNDMPDPQLFLSSVGKLVCSERQAAADHGTSLTVFGEMVAILWNEGNKSGALALERLWNDLLHDRAFHLHCAYPRRILVDDSELTIQSICDEHSSVLGIPARQRDVA